MTPGLYLCPGSKGSPALVLCQNARDSFLGLLAPGAQVVAPLVDYEGVVLDATNPLTPWPELNLSVDQNTTSAAEEIQKVSASPSPYSTLATSVQC